MPQDLVEDVLVDEAEKDQLRRELFDFLEEFRHKKNDEGEPLIQFPKNFDRISDAMTRQDLISTEDKWVNLNATFFVLLSFSLSLYKDRALPIHVYHFSERGASTY